MSEINVKVIDSVEESNDNKRFEVKTQVEQVQSFTLGQLRAQKEMLLKDKENFIKGNDAEIAKIDAIISEANKQLA